MTLPQLLRTSRASCMVLAMTAVACARPVQDAGVANPVPSARGATRVTATVFTDSVLFKQVCAESDSGLTMRANRCTPRDQAVILRKP